MVIIMVKIKARISDTHMINENENNIGSINDISNNNNKNKSNHGNDTRNNK